jgi:hypothetical protein
MALLPLAAGRLIAAGAFTAAIVISPAIAIFAGPNPTVSTTAACTGGESEDPYTMNCIPEVAPAGTSSSPVGPPSETALTRCSGGDQGECLEQALYPGAPVVQPNTSVQSSP